MILTLNIKCVKCNISKFVLYFMHYSVCKIFAFAEIYIFWLWNHFVWRKCVFFDYEIFAFAEIYVFWLWNYFVWRKCVFSGHEIFAFEESVCVPVMKFLHLQEARDFILCYFNVCKNRVLLLFFIFSCQRFFRRRLLRQKLWALLAACFRGWNSSSMKFYKARIPKTRLRLFAGRCFLRNCHFSG